MTSIISINNKNKNLFIPKIGKQNTKHVPKSVLLYIKQHLYNLPIHILYIIYYSYILSLCKIKMQTLQYLYHWTS